MRKLNWQKWKVGVAVAAISGLCLALVPLATTPEMSLRSFAFCVAAFMGREVVAFFHRHPVESISEDSIKPKPKDNS
jgi:hypothetical protein